MAVSSIKAFFNCDIQRLWDTVTSLESYGWRSDISKIDVLSENRFVEHSKDGFATEFTVTAFEPCARWAFDLENVNMKGHWTGVFTARDGGAEIEFTEEVTAKKLIMKPLVKGFLKKQQETYIEDLKKALS